jgi:hypothetical protein
VSALAMHPNPRPLQGFGVASHRGRCRAHSGVSMAAGRRHLASPFHRRTGSRPDRHSNRHQVGDCEVF